MSKTDYVMIRVSDDEKEAIKNKALKRGMSVSQYLRFLAITDEPPNTADKKADKDNDFAYWIKNGLI